MGRISSTSARGFLLGAVLLGKVAVAKPPDAAVADQSFFDFARSFCANKKSLSAHYRASIEPKRISRPWLREKMTGESDLSFLCPQSLHFKVEFASFRYELITDGVQAWVVHQITGRAPYIEQYNQLAKRELGDWLSTFARQLSKKGSHRPGPLRPISITRIVREKSGGEPRQQFKLTYPGEVTSLVLEASLVPQPRIFTIELDTGGFTLHLSFANEVSGSSAEDLKTYVYLAKPGEKINFISDAAPR